MLRQFLMMVELKSGGGCKLLRSSTTEAERIRDGEIETREKKKMGRRKVEGEMEMEERILRNIVGIEEVSMDEE